MEELLTTISVLSTICAIIFGYLAFARNRKKDDMDTGGSRATMLSEIGYVKANTDDIKEEQRKQRELNTDVLCRLGVVENRADRTDARLLKLEGEKQHEN